MMIDVYGERQQRSRFSFPNSNKRTNVQNMLHYSHGIMPPIDIMAAFSLRSQQSNPNGLSGGISEGLGQGTLIPVPVPIRSTPPSTKVHIREQNAPNPHRCHRTGRLRLPAPDAHQRCDHHHIGPQPPIRSHGRREP